MKLYLDTDIFLALIKGEDRHKDAAQRFFLRFKGHEFVTSSIALLEIWFYLYKNDQKTTAFDAMRAVRALCSIIETRIDHIEEGALLSTACRLSPADAVHAIVARFCDAIVSSDHSFDNVSELKRIDFTHVE